MQNDQLKKLLPLFIAAGVALVVVIYYLSSGRSSLDQNIRQLEKSSPVQHIQTTDNTVLVNCKNGESYEIVYQPGQTNFQNLVYDKCGAEGALTGTEQEVQ